MRVLKGIWLILAATLILAHCAPKPTEKGMDGKVKAKARLQLADGSTISRDDSEEYNPYLVQLSDGYLVLVFGSDRNGGLHNIFVTKSIQPYNGFEVPAFDPPVVVTASSSPIDDTSPINFAATANGTSVDLYVNLHTASGFIRKGTVTDPSAPDVGTFATITNTNQESNTIIGINADGADLITTDAGGIAYLVNPSNSNPSNAFGANLNYSTSATQVRFDNSGFNDAYMGSNYGSTFAVTATDFFGPIFDFDISLAESGLTIGQMTTFYDGYSAYGDMVLFSANDGLSSDIYVVTSHTAGMLWSMVAFFGFDTFLPAAPLADHWYDFESNCNDTPAVVAWNGSCTAVSFTPGSVDGTNYGQFTNASSVFDIGLQNLGSAFSFSMWIQFDSFATCASACLIAANSAYSPNTADGFRFYADNTGALHFVTGDGSTGTSASSTGPGVVTTGTWYHVTITYNQAFSFAMIYVDGAVPISYSPTMTQTFNTNQVVTFGRTGSTVSLDARIDNLKIFEYELDPMSVLALYLQ